MDSIKELDKNVELKYEVETIGRSHILNYIIPSVIVVMIFLLYVLN